MFLSSKDNLISVGYPIGSKPESVLWKALHKFDICVGLMKQIPPLPDSSVRFLFRISCAGSTRALDEWPEIDFTDDRDGCLFKAIVHRKEVDGKVLPTVSGKTSGKVSGKTSGKILEAILQNNTITIPELSLRRSLN